MTRYLLTEDQYNATVQAMEALGVDEPLANVKPIEPLTNNAIDDYGFNMLPQVMRKDFTAFARAVEAHILGEKHEDPPWVLAELADNGGQP